MTNNKLLLQTIVGNQLGIPPNQVDPDAHFAKELGADSLDVIEIVLTVEYDFGINIEDLYASKISNIQEILAYMDRLTHLENLKKYFA
jgi:acyl carrier protein